MIAAAFIWTIHLAVVLFVALTPFFDVSWELYMLHFITSSTLIFRWIVGIDGCILTALECYLRGIPNTRSFMHSLVSPFYTVADEQLQTKLLVVSALSLGSITRLYICRSKINEDLASL